MPYSSLQADGRPLHILIVRVGAMGDVLHGLPAVAALRMAMPEAFIGWAVEPRWQPLLQADDAAATGRSHARPLVDMVHPVDARAWSRQPFSAATLRSISGLRTVLRGQRYDVAIDLQGSIRSSTIAWMSGAVKRAGSATPRESPARWLYTQRVPLRAPHVVEQAAEIVSAAAGHSLLPVTLPPLPIDGAQEAWAEALLAGDRRPVAFLAPTAGWGAKQWPAEHFAATARALSAAGLRVLVNRAGPQDTVAAAVLALAEGLAEPADASVAGLAALLRRVSVVIAGDTGPLHLAAALGVPTVALFGPTDPARNGPWGNAARVLRSAGSRTSYKRDAETEPGLAGIAVAEVVDAVEELLRRPGAL